MNSTGRSSSHGLKKRGIHEAEPHNHDEDDNKIVKKKKVFDGDDEELVSIRGGLVDHGKKFLKLAGAFRYGQADALGMDNKPILGVDGKPVKVKATVTTRMLLTEGGMVAVAGGAHATQYLTKNSIDGFLKTSTGGLLALPVISDIVSVLLVDTTGSLIQHGATEPIQFLINLVVGDQYKEYYSSIFRIHKNTYCTNGWKDQLKGAIIFSVEGNEMINFLPPSVQLIGKVVGNVFKDFFVNLIKKLEGFEMMRNHAAEILTGLYDMLGMFFSGVFPHITRALTAFANKLSKKALFLYEEVQLLFNNHVMNAVKTFEAIRTKSNEILDKFINMIDTAIKKVTGLQEAHRLIVKRRGAPGGYVQTASKASDDYVNEADQKVSETIEVDEMNPDLAIELKARDEAVSEYQSYVLGKNDMYVYLAKWVFGDVRINWVDPSKLHAPTLREKAYLATKNSLVFYLSGQTKEQKKILQKEGSLIV